MAEKDRSLLIYLKNSIVQDQTGQKSSLFIIYYDFHFDTGEKFVYRSDEGAVVEFDCSDNTTTIVMDNSSFVSPFFFSNFGQMII